MTRRLNFDLDGVYFDFDTGFRQLFGQDHKAMSDRLMWQTILEHGEFFANLPLFDGAQAFFNEFAHHNPTFLSAAPPSDYARIARQKKAAVRKHLSNDATILVITGGRNKALFMHAPGDVLVDDFEVNCEAWDAAGGIAILHTDFASTRTQLAKLFPPLGASGPTLTPQQKLQAMRSRFYDGLVWRPRVGDHYTTSRDDLELYTILSIENGVIETRNLTRPESTGSTRWDLTPEQFTTIGFGPKRVFVPAFILGTPVAEMGLRP